MEALKSAFSQMSDVGQKSNFIYSDASNLNISLEPLISIADSFKLNLSNGTDISRTDNILLAGIQRHRLDTSIDPDNVLFLGTLKADLSLIELYSRNISEVKIDLNILKKSEILECKDAKPSGLTTEELAQIARYLGFSNTIKNIVITNADQKLLLAKNTTEILAEFIWYLSEGYKNRIKEDPYSKDYASTQHLQHSEFTHSIILYKSKKSQRRWVSGEDDKTLIPCSLNEYDQLLKNEIPQRLWPLLIS